MISAQTVPQINILTDYKFTPKEIAFIFAYLATGNASQAVRDAGYNVKAPDKYASALLARDGIRAEVAAQIEHREQERIAKPTEILNFYTSVMRGEVLDQFGIEASIDTRIKAANELAKHQIEIPLKLQQKENSNNIGSITLNFIPRKEENEE